MTLRARILVVAVAVAVLGGAAGLVLLVLLRPLATYEAMERGRLRWLGFEAQATEAPRGPQVAWRAGRGPVVLFLHGANDRAATWSRVAGSLVFDRRVVLLDLAGHGDSAPYDGPLEVADLLAGVEAVAEAEAPNGGVTLVGNSLGGWLALLYARRHPERVSHVVLVNGAAVRGDGSEAAVNLLPTNREEARAAVDATISPASPRPPAFVLDDLVRRSAGSPLARLMAAPVPDEYVLDGRLGALTVPVTLLWGADDRVLPVGYAEKVAAALPAARLVIIPRCGHIPQRECYERLEPLLARALEAPPARRP